MTWGWSGSPSRGSASCSWAVLVRRISRRSRLCPSSVTSIGIRASRAGSVTLALPRVGSASASETRKPAPDGGQRWARDRVRDGDAVCLENQMLRLQTLDPIEFTTTRPYYEPLLMDPRSPIEWIGDTQVPIFLSGAWQDEQTGPGFTSLLTELPLGRANKVTLVNGVHSSTLEPEILYEWIAFLDLYVAGTLPDPGRSAPFASVIAAEILGSGAPTPPLPVDRYDFLPNMAAARYLFTSTARFRVLMENGAGSSTPGLPAPTFELGFDRWPPRRAKPRAWYFGDAGTLSRKRLKRGADGVASYRPDPEARPMQTLPGTGQSDSWRVMPPYDWRPLLGDAAVAWSTEALEDDVIIVGAGSVDLWLRSSAEDTDLQVTLSEVRSDGREAYVQSGWLRASHRTLNRRASSRLEPVHTHLEADATPMPASEFTAVRVPIMSAAHVFRRGSRIRISVEAPGGDRTRWAFDTPTTGGSVLNEVAFSREMASRLVLPVVGGVTPPPGPVPCPGLRGQPCRDYVPASNGG